MTETTLTPPVEETKPDLLSRPLLVAATLDWEKIAYLTFFVVAIITRFWGLGDRVVSHDESLHTQYAYQYYNGDGYQHQALMHGPFLFHITAVFYWLFGDNDFVARVPVAIFGVLLVLFPYVLRPWLGRIGAVVTSFVFLISPYVLYYSRYIRHDIYVIIWALIVFAATWYYLQRGETKFLLWFAAGLALMFSTKEVAFIYVAIFGSFLALRLTNRIRLEPWFRESWSRLALPLALAALAVVLIGAGMGAERIVAGAPDAATSEATSDLFAADPTQADQTAVAGEPQTIWPWLTIGGLVLLGGSLWLAADRLRPHLDGLREFDLVVLYATLLLPSISPLLTKLAGWSPVDYSYSACPSAAGSSILAQLFSGDCWGHLVTQGAFRSGVFLVPTIIIAVLVGLWWDRRRWLAAVLVFQSIFTLLYTSMFTHPAGWFSGTLESLGYWLEQQAVERGSQPRLYYFFVVPFYEFLPVIFSLLAFRLWARRQQIHKVAGYWVTVGLLALLAWSFGGWLYNLPVRADGGQPESWPGYAAAAIVLFVAGLLWLFVWQPRLRKEYDLKPSWNGLVDSRAFFEFVPGLIWWLVLTVVAYSLAGEKMPWLSIHFVIPMALLTGWYFNIRLAGVDRNALLSRDSLLQIGLTAVFLIVLGLALGPVLLGGISLGDATFNNLVGIGRFLGMLIVAAAVFAIWRRYSVRGDAATRRRSWLLGGFLLLSLLTIRFALMASFPNADYVTEFMVYAHGAPATKSEVMQQVDELSLRLYGDRSMDIAYDNDTSWPMTWYLRTYPNRTYFGESPTRDILESPAIIAGSVNWDKVDPIIGDQYEPFRHTFLWWPMEEYRQISWDAILGLQNGRVPEDPTLRRGLGNARLRQGLWDIFFYRDYTKYGEVMNRDLSLGQWPLRRDLRLYIRRDVLANLWDYGAGAVNAEAPVDPYAEGELTPAPLTVFGAGQGAGDGQLASPRNVAIAPDGRVYVADSGNHRIQVFDANGQFLFGWGGFGSAPGLFNEPWGLRADEAHLYVADTWNHRIQKFTLDGEFVAQYGELGQIAAGDLGAGVLYGPRDVVLLDDGRLLITDTGNHRLVALDQDLNFVDSVGQLGAQLGFLHEPVGLARAADGSVYVDDTWNGRIQQFQSNLLPINEWRVDAWLGDSINNKPYLAVDSNGYVYTTDPEKYRVLVFNRAGEYAARFGGFGVETANFGLPNGIAIDAEDNIYIADAGNHRIVKFPPLSLGAIPPPADDPILVQPTDDDEE